MIDGPQATWRSFFSDDAGGRALRANCSRRRCGIVLGRIHPNDVEARIGQVELPRGFVRRGSDDLVELSPRAKKQWDKAKRERIPWNEFAPTLRHNPRGGKNSLEAVASGRAGWYFMRTPFNIVCPQCGLENALDPSLVHFHGSDEICGDCPPLTASPS